MYPTNKIKPENVVLDEFSPLVETEPGLPDRNINMPKDIKRATAYSYFWYVFLDTIHPIAMTGMILEALAKTWVGKLMNFRASY